MSDKFLGEGSSDLSPIDPIAYDEVARHFFAEFLALRDQIRAGADPLSLQKEAMKERHTAVEFKRQAQELASRNEALELVIEDMERQATAMRKQLNEALFEVARLQELQSGRRHAPGSGVPFIDRLDEQSKKEWQKLMTERPSSNPNRREERE